MNNATLVGGAVIMNQELDRIRLDEIAKLQDAIDHCKKVLKNSMCLEQAQDALDEIELASYERNKLIKELIQ